MKSKDKRIIVFNLPVGQMSNAEIPEYVQRFAEYTKDVFDDSVIKFIAPTRNEDKDVLQVVSDFPVAGREAIKSILESEDTMEEKLKKIGELVNIKQDGRI